MKSGTNKLRIAGIIYIIFGAVSLLSTWLIMKNGDASAAGLDTDTAFMYLIGAYISGGFQLFAGLMGILLSKKRSLFTVILGVLLYIPALWTFFQSGGAIKEIIKGIIQLLIPYLYLHNAYVNYRER